MAGIYIHIPFCKQACHYCNFYFSTSLANKERLIGALLKEIELSGDYLESERIETIYFGGGTPSLLSAMEIFRIIEKIGKYHDITPLKEFTIEANPDDLTPQKIAELSELKQVGLNRFSVGIQSFFDEDLKYMNRAHNAAEALSSIKRVQDAGFDNITLDLIYGTPTMNDDAWHKNLQQAFALNVPHISSYGLTVEPKTQLAKNIAKQQSKPVDEEQSARQFNILMNEMRAHDYDQYEISNFAKPGRHAIHNSNYWSGHKYLGLGPSAHSYNRLARRWNVANNISYIQAIDSGHIMFEEEVLTDIQQVNERIMTSLRTMWGLNLIDMDIDKVALIMKALKNIPAAHYILNDGVLTLTQEGRLFADAIAADLFL